MSFNIPFFLAFLLSLDFVTSQFKCDFRMYGRPKLEDCASTFMSLPDAREVTATLKLGTFRKFVEPQFLDPPFSHVDNDLGSEMEQLPKFWRYKQCRVALMATADSRGQVLDPEIVSTWAFIEHNALKVNRHCIGGREGGGLVLISDGAGGIGALCLYVYAVGSLFEDVLNNYMITSQPLHPPELLENGVNGSLLWEAVNGTSETPSSTDISLLQNLQERPAPITNYISNQ